MNPIERAKQFEQLKAEHGTNENVAALVNLSTAQVSRYLSLLKLPQDLQMKVASGELPVTQPKRALKKQANTAPTYSALSDIQRLIIEQLARVTFVTQQQMADYVNRSLNVTRHAMNELAEARFLEAHREIRPYVYRLAAHGATVAGVTKPRHWMSANAIHQRVLRNAIELHMRTKNASANFVSRKQCWKQGLFPSVGEHLLTYQKGEQNERVLVLIDDYLMKPNRIAHCLSRPHDQNKSVSAGQLVLSWQDVVGRVLVCCTDERHTQQHVRFVEIGAGQIGLPVQVIHVSPVWSTF